MLSVTVLVGNPKPRSRTLVVAEALVAALLPSDTYTLTTIDLVDYANEMFAWPSETMSALSSTVASSDLLIVASPTYKATYTGLLKSFLDRYANLGLRGVTAIGVMTGADLTHALGAETHLRPLLTELGATLPVRSLYFVTSQMEQLDQVVGDFAADALDVLARQRSTFDRILDSQPVPVGAES